jgi:polysaccharide deacetylase family protein (PEP-CTERM system associated)
VVEPHTESPNGEPLLNAISVDVEEHFQVSAFEKAISRADWAHLESRVEANTDRLLQLFADCGVRATFFVLGWIAERYPGLVRRIADEGHEIGSHGFDHRLIFEQTPEQFAEELSRSKDLIEQAGGQAVRGYRAASFSITRKSLWALDSLAEAGFHYDSSIFPVYHDRYGMPGAPRHIYQVDTRGGGRIVEFPPSTIRIGRLVLPVGGGGYLRIYPFALTRWAIRRLNRRDEIPANVYLHPWEVDPEQPRIRASLKSRLRHYTNLSTTEKRLRTLMSRFRFGPVGEVVKRRAAAGLQTVTLAGEPRAASEPAEDSPRAASDRAGRLGDSSR